MPRAAGYESLWRALRKPLVAEIHPERCFSADPAFQPQSKSHCCQRIAAWSPACIEQAVAPRRCDMFWNSLGNISSGTRQTAYQGVSEPKLGETFANASSPAFDAWLQVYRKRLEEVCQ